MGFKLAVGSAFFLFSIVVIGCGGAGSNPTAPPVLSGIIVASGIEGSQNALYKMNADGTGRTKLTNMGFTSSLVRISPDKTKALYVESGELHAINLDGTGKVDFPKVGGASASDGNASWSSDSNTIVYQHNPGVAGGVTDVRVSRVSNPTAFTVIASGANWPVVNPAGTKVVYVDISAATGQGGRFVRTCNLDGTGVALVGTVPAAQSGQNPQFSRDGSKIIFQNISDGNKLIIVNSDGTGQMTPNGSDWWPFYRTPVTDDNNTYFATVLAATRSVGRVNITTGAKTTLVTSTTEGFFDPVLSPDGTKVAVTQSSSLPGLSGIRIMDLNGNSPVTMGTDIKAAYGDWK